MDDNVIRIFRDADNKITKIIKTGIISRFGSSSHIVLPKEAEGHKVITLVKFLD